MGAFFRGLTTETEFKNLSSASTSQVATVMKWKTGVRCTLYFLIFVTIFFLLKWDLFEEILNEKIKFCQNLFVT